MLELLHFLTLKIPNKNRMASSSWHHWLVFLGLVCVNGTLLRVLMKQLSRELLAGPAAWGPCPACSALGEVRGGIRPVVWAAKSTQWSLWLPLLEIQDDSLTVATSRSHSPWVGHAVPAGKYSPTHGCYGRKAHRSLTSCWYWSTGTWRWSDITDVLPRLCSSFLPLNEIKIHSILWS